MARFLLLGLFAAALTGCAAKAQAPLPSDAPALLPPPPPARVIVPAPANPTLPAEEPATPPSPPSRTRETTPPARSAPPPATPPPADPTPIPVLSTSGNPAEFEKRIRAQLTRAERDLDQVKRPSLGADARAQYDAARSFVRQAEDALKVRNLVFAGQLADKAATLAALLRGVPSAF